MKSVPGEPSKAGECTPPQVPRARKLLRTPHTRMLMAALLLIHKKQILSPSHCHTMVRHWPIKVNDFTHVYFSEMRLSETNQAAKRLHAGRLSGAWNFKIHNTSVMDIHIYKDKINVGMRHSNCREKGLEKDLVISVILKNFLNRCSEINMAKC